MEPQVYPFRCWLKANGISPATGYRLVREGAIKLTKIRVRSYITKAESERWLAALPSIQKGDAA